MFGLSWGTIASGLASGVGFAVGGPVGSALLGGATSMAFSLGTGHSFTQSLETGLISGAAGFIPGGLVGDGLVGITNAFSDATTAVLTKGLGNIVDRSQLVTAGIDRLGLGSMAAAAGTGAGNEITNYVLDKQNQAGKHIVLPTVNIGNGE